MKARFALACTLSTLLAGSAVAQTVILNENFDQYGTDQEAYRAVWAPTLGNGSGPTTDPAEADRSRVIDNSTIPPGTNISDIEGTAAAHLGGTSGSMVNQYGGVINQGAGEQPDLSFAPSATENVRLSFDFFDSGAGGERMTLGLRNISVSGATVTTTNIIEMGFYNAYDPTPIAPPPGAAPNGAAGVATIGYAFRTVLIPGSKGWQYWLLPPELDGSDADTIVKFNDIGPGWHTYTAEFSATGMTFEIDLFRDGLRNTSITPDEVTGIRPGAAGVDGSSSFDLPLVAGGFNSVRIGGPSGLNSGGTGLNAFDNILLQMVPADVPATDNADFDGDGDVDGADFLTWQRGLGEPGDRADGNANPTVDGDVDADDLAVWKAQFGAGSTPAAPAASAIPEPAAFALAFVGLMAGMAARRRR
jgi:hypothetical protein